MSAIRHMILPVITLSVAPTTEVIRLMRISTIEVYDQNYVKAAATPRFVALYYFASPRSA